MLDIPEEPQVEDTTHIEEEAHEIVKPVTEITGNTSILKIKVNGNPYYHFKKDSFDTELAKKNKSIYIQGKHFYEGKKDNGMFSRMNLKSNK